jgi:hypothetical protein
MALELMTCFHVKSSPSFQQHTTFKGRTQALGIVTAWFQQLTTVEAPDLSSIGAYFLT